MRQAILASALLLIVGFAGCLEDSSSGLTANNANGTQEPASSVVVEPEKGVFVAENRGILRGTVVNDAGLKVTSARVSILGTEFYQVTGRDGAFVFENVTVGVKKVRVEASGYRAAEKDEEVKAGNITTTEIVLLPLEDTGAGYREHLHDFWGGKTEATVLDEDVDLRKKTGSYGGAGGTNTQQTISGVTYSTSNSSSEQNKFVLRLPSGRDPPSLVYPGTKEIQITISWTSSSFTGYKVGVGFRPQNADRYYLERKVSGSTWSISVLPEWWDSGHQWYSFWYFYVYTVQSYDLDGTNYRPGIITGPVHITIKLIKGELLPEPPHPKFWQNGDTLELHTHEKPPTNCENAYRLIERDWCRVRPSQIVPPGTGKLMVEMKWTYGTYQGTPPLDLTLVYRLPHMDPSTTPVTAYKIASCTGTGQVRQCEIPVKPGDTDAYYQKTSQWELRHAIKGQETQETEIDPRGVSLSMHIIAHKDPGYSEES